jgi:aminodeoxyfutalosine synthase
LSQLADQVRAGLVLDGVVPTPAQDCLGLATLLFVARCRLGLAGVPHVLVDLDRLGPKLGQLALGFGADELCGPIVVERALRLGDNVGSHAITRAEAAQLLRGAGLRACERVAGGGLEEFAP